MGRPTGVVVLGANKSRLEPEPSLSLRGQTLEPCAGVQKQPGLVPTLDWWYDSELWLHGVWFDQSTAQLCDKLLKTWSWRNRQTNLVSKKSKIVHAKDRLCKDEKTWMTMTFWSVWAFS